MAHQPIFDTLQVADEMEHKGMEREQAKGLAQVLGNQLGEHVAVRQDLDAGFEGVRAEVTVARAEVGRTRTELEGQIHGVRAEVGRTRTELEAQIHGVRAEVAVVRAEVSTTRAELTAKIDGVNGKLNLGFALMMAFLTAVAGMQLFALTRPPAAVPPALVAPPAAAPATAQPGPSPAALLLGKV